MSVQLSRFIQVCRRRLRFGAAACALVLLCVPLLGPGWQSPRVMLTADRILHNGQIVTVDEDFRIAEALAIRFSPAGSEIMAVGSDEEVLALRDSDTEVTDLGGRVVIPGIIDSHLHFSLLGIEAAFEADLRRAMSVSDVVEEIRELVERRQLAEGEWLVARGWDEYKYDRPFTRWDIDAGGSGQPGAAQSRLPRPRGKHRGL